MTNNKKEKFLKRKKFLSIFIPTVGSATFLSVLVPIVCLANHNANLIIEPEHRSTETHPGVPATFEFKKSDVNIKAENLKCDWSYMPSSQAEIKIKDILVKESTENKILIETNLVKQDGSPAQPTDCICFKLNFTYSDDTNSWTQSFANMYIYVADPGSGN